MNILFLYPEAHEASESDDDESSEDYDLISSSNIDDPSMEPFPNATYSARGKRVGEGVSTV